MPIINPPFESNNVTYIKRICSNCGYVFIPVDHSDKCEKCNHHLREYLNHLAMKRGIETWR